MQWLAALSVHRPVFATVLIAEFVRLDTQIRRRHWGSFESRVTPNTCKLLDLLARSQTRATFLYWVGSLNVIQG